MSIRKTTLFIIVFCFTILLLVLFVITRSITYSKFEALEDKLIVANLNRSVNAIYAMVSNLDIMVADWSFWDDTYLFLQGKKDDYINSNLPIETFINHQNNIIMLLDTKKELVWGKYLPPSGDKLLPLPDGIIKSINPLINSPETNPEGINDKTGFKGIILFNNTLYMISCKPILTSEQRGPYLGWFIMARELEDITINNLEERTELDLEIVNINDKDIPYPIYEIVKSIKFNKSQSNAIPPIIEKRDKELICSGIIMDIKGEPAAVISVKASREIFESGEAASSMILVTIIITGIFMGGISIFLLEKRVLKRILTLNNQVQFITKHRHNKWVGINGDDEIASLSKSIQEMLNKLQESQSFLTQILEAIPAGVVVLDEDSGIVREISLTALDMIGKSYEEVIGTTNIPFLLPYPSEIFDESEYSNSDNKILIKSMETTLITEQGNEIPVLRSVARIMREGKPMLLEMFVDFTELHATQKALRDSERKYKILFMNTGNATMIIDEDGIIQLANQEFIKLTKIPQDQSIIGRSAIDFFHPDETNRLMEFHKLRRSNISSIRSSAPREYETRFKDYNGNIRFVSLTVAIIPDTTTTICSMLDITDWKKAEQALEKKAFFDSLTNLPNRQLFNNRLEHALDFARRNRTMIGIFVLDIDDFKNVNDSMGHHSGDRVLQEIAFRLNNQIRKTDTIARLGGDEFALLIQDLYDVDDLCRIADVIIEDFKHPFIINNMEFYLGVSIGISVFPNDGTDSEMLLKNADLAMYQSKQHGKNIYRIFTEELNKKAQARISLERDLRQAISTENFEVYYQPKIFIKTGVVYGMEALVRGKRADGNIIPPNQFIPFAETSGLIVPIDLIVLKKACMDTVRWLNILKRKIVVSVNISTRHFLIKDFVESVKEILDITGLPPSSLELEVTETALMKDIGQAMSSIKKLNEMGVSFSLDDFGTGYSSLYYLSNLPFQTLKIDKSFIDHICDEKGSSELVKIIISLAGNMDMKVVAEGVEKQEQLELLKNLGCDQAQGYLVSRPIPAKQFELFLLSSGSSQLS
ncbi:MAG: EAL domain-containing protein [Desulfamplus sp.]|nr:EAL domain-containing protein [Desulfamplus sp.]